MCSSRGICGDIYRPNRSSSSEGTCAGARYALCALGVGLIVLGTVMIVWTGMPMEKRAPRQAPKEGPTEAPDATKGNSDVEDNKSYLVVIGLIGAGICILLVVICVCMRSKKREGNASSQPVATGVPLMNNVAREQEEAAADRPSFNVPSYEEVVGSGDYPVRQSNLLNSTSLLPSYEDILAAVENEGAEPTDDPSEATPPNDPTPAEPDAELQDDPSGLRSNPSMPTRSASRASRILKSLRVRRIKSDKLHLKAFRLQIRSPTQNPVTIEPITPPPQYDNKMPEFE